MYFDPEEIMPRLSKSACDYRANTLDGSKTSRKDSECLSMPTKQSSCYVREKKMVVRRISRTWNCPPIGAFSVKLRHFRSNGYVVTVAGLVGQSGEVVGLWRSRKTHVRGFKSYLGQHRRFLVGS